jgi:hypothetical protein
MDDLFQLMTMILRLIRWPENQPPQSGSINHPRAIEDLAAKPIDQGIADLWLQEGLVPQLIGIDPLGTTRL